MMDISLYNKIKAFNCSIEDFEKKFEETKESIHRESPEE